MEQGFGGGSREHADDLTAQAWQQIQALGNNEQVVDEQNLVHDETELSPDMTREAQTLGARATAFFEEHFPNLTKKVRESRIYRAIVAGLGRMDATKVEDMAQADARHEELPGEYDAQLLEDVQGEMQRTMEEMYADDSRLVKEMGDEISKDEEIAWELAEEPRKPGELSLVSLFMKNPQIEGETVENYKARLHNYQKQDVVRKNQIVADVAYVEVHPEESVNFNEARTMIHDAALVTEYPKAARAMRLAQARPEKEVRDENGDLDLTWFYQAYPRRTAETSSHYGQRIANEAEVGEDGGLEVVYDVPQVDETIEEYTERVVSDNPGLTEEEMQQFLIDQKENAELDREEDESIEEKEKSAPKPPVKASVQIKEDIGKYRQEIEEIKVEDMYLTESQKKQIVHDQEKITELEGKLRVALQKELMDERAMRAAIEQRIEKGRGEMVTKMKELLARIDEQIELTEQELQAA